MVAVETMYHSPSTYDERTSAMLTMIKRLLNVMFTPEAIQDRASMHGIIPGSF